ncbi:hypothetical protein ABE205_19600 [Brevibacillus agri]|uniref:hypothetical protein n=1 Tax=Brevibacillus agri TaxID=51101 RepID=UPI003D19371C
MGTEEIRQKLHSSWNNKAHCFNRLMDKLDQLQQSELTEEVKSFNKAWCDLLYTYLEAEKAGVSM